MKLVEAKTAANPIWLGYVPASDSADLQSVPSKQENNCAEIATFLAMTFKHDYGCDN